MKVAMKIETEQKGLIVRITLLEDRLDAALTPEFLESMQALIEQGNRRFVLDCSHVDFFDSTALGALVQCMKRIRLADDGKGQMVLCGINSKLMSLLKLTRLDRAFFIVSDCGEAEGSITEY